MHDVATPPAPSPLQQVLEEAETSCIKCGFCLPVCPTYRLTGNEAASPRGRIDLMQAVADGDLDPVDMAHELDFCLGCRACETVCPAGVSYGTLLEAGRAVVREGVPTSRLSSWVEWLSLRVLLSSPLLLWLVASVMRVYQVSGLQRFLRASGVLRSVSPELAELEASMPVIPSSSERRPISAETPALEGERDAVAMLTGCVMPELLPQINHATVCVLAANGYRVLAPPAQRCCGALQAHAGDLETARQLARHNIAVFETTGLGAIVVNSAGCGAAMKEYGHLLADDPVFASRAQTFSQRVRDVSELLDVRPLRIPLDSVPLRVAYDDPCHLLHGQQVREPPRSLLRQIPHLELVDVRESDWCCGSAGIYNLTHAETAMTLLERKMEHLVAAEPQLIVTGNPGCILQLRQGVKRHQLDLEVVHPIEVLAQAYGSSTPAS